MKEDKIFSIVGVGFCSMLTIIFIVLKLTGVIGWPWILVIAPLWIPIAVSALFIGFLLFAAWLRKRSK